MSGAALNVTLYNSDCMEILRNMPDASVDHIITDPPYGERTHKGARTGGNGHSDPNSGKAVLVDFNVCSYLAREADKGGREDIEKAYHTMGIYLELTEE